MIDQENRWKEGDLHGQQMRRYGWAATSRREGLVERPRTRTKACTRLFWATEGRTRKEEGCTSAGRVQEGKKASYGGDRGGRESRECARDSLPLASHPLATIVILPRAVSNRPGTCFPGLEGSLFAGIPPGGVFLLWQGRGNTRWVKQVCHGVHCACVYTSRTTKG